MADNDQDAGDRSDGDNQKSDKMFTLKKWNAVAMWSWDVECDTCAICRVQVMGESCLSINARRLLCSVNLVFFSLQSHTLTNVYHSIHQSRLSLRAIPANSCLPSRLSVSRVISRSFKCVRHGAKAVTRLSRGSLYVSSNDTPAKDTKYAKNATVCSLSYSLFD